jgi:hypothetical protein
MEYTKLGRTGLDVSRICLGCMSYGGSNRGNHAWSLSEEESRPFIQRALEAGINFFDTANRYSLGKSEEILGRATRDFARRDEVVIATKVYGRMRPGPNGVGLSRKAIFAEIDASLTQLGMDYVDLYQIHRWDYNTPIEETLEARRQQINELARNGRYPSGPVVPAVSRGFAAFERQGFSAAIDALEPIASELERIGGSRAQLDLVEFTLLQAYAGAKRLDDAHRMLRARHRGSSSPPVTGLAAVH